MEDKVFLLVKCTIKTNHRHIHEAMQELQNGTRLELTSTKNVTILNAEIMKMNTKTTKH